MCVAHNTFAYPRTPRGKDWLIPTENPLNPEYTLL